MPVPTVVRLKDSVQVWSPAKVNLHLEVHGRRPDGYHELSTLIVPISLYDTLQLWDCPTGGIRLECDEPRLPTGPENLIVQAATRLRDRYAPGRGALISLNKRIPFEAGLGGGSGNAAATILGLEAVWGISLQRDQRSAVAAECGSDVPCFLAEAASWCTGRGELVVPATMGARLHLVIVKPLEGLSTRAVFSCFKMEKEAVSREEVRGALAAGNMPALGKALFNRLEKAACEALGALVDLRASMLAAGPLGVVMTGSGSAMVALASSADHAAALGRHYRDLGTAAGPVRIFVVASTE
jgi:4-diphosphocytidyl-2-C-methyl-D-erythritol kinase